MKNQLPYLLTEDVLKEDILQKKVDRQDIEKCTEGFLLMRLRGTQISIRPDGMTIHGWMVNIVSSGSVIVRLPLLLRIETDAEKKICHVAILNEFKGSQGILCSKKYLQRHLEQKLVGTDFAVSNPVIASEVECACLHVQEIFMGAISFHEQCVRKELIDAYESETCYFYGCDDDIVMLGRNKSSAFDEVNTKIVFPDAMNRMKFDKSFKLYLEEEQKMACSYGKDFEECTETAIRKNRAVQMEMLRSFVPVFRSFGKRIDCRGDYFFTCLYPKTLIGLLTEAIALKQYSSNYVYFQKCLLDLQRKDGKPKCIGAVDNIREAAEVFRMEMSDLEE